MSATSVIRVVVELDRTWSPSKPVVGRFLIPSIAHIFAGNSHKPLCKYINWLLSMRKKIKFSFVENTLYQVALG